MCQWNIQCSPVCFCPTASHITVNNRVSLEHCSCGRTVKSSAYLHSKKPIRERQDLVQDYAILPVQISLHRRLYLSAQAWKALNPWQCKTISCLLTSKCAANMSSDSVNMSGASCFFWLLPEKGKTKQNNKRWFSSSTKEKIQQEKLFN